MQAIALEEAETKIRKTVKYEYFSRMPKAKIDKKVYDIIRLALKDIELPVLKDAAVRSLRKFYQKQYNELVRSFGRLLPVFSAVLLLSGKRLNGDAMTPTHAQKQRAMDLLEENGYGSARIMGTPLQRYSEEYIKKNIAPVLERLAKQEAKDPDDITGRNSLRNRAEMEVRYQGHINEVAGLRGKGVKLVIASAHADCSQRCMPWQGRVFSLDGTSGTTEDGRHYVPLEEATNVPYVTKAGRTYMNGLLGFNCRHYLVEYRNGYQFPKPNPFLEKREYQITEEQRRLERNVRIWRTRAVESQGQDAKTYKKAKAKAKEWNDAYIAFSKANNRAYYPSRTKIL